MKIVGFSFTKISAEKAVPVLKKTTLNTHIIFTELEKEKNDFLKESDIIRVNFQFDINYEDADKKGSIQGHLTFEGLLILSTTPEETKNFTKAWKKKETPKEYVLPLYNFILKKCTVRALDLEEEVGLPTHVALPTLKPSQ